MDLRRQGEIALMLVKHYIHKHGITLTQGDMREFGNIAKAIGVSPEELKEFTKPLVLELIKERLGYKG